MPTSPRFTRRAFLSAALVYLVGGLLLTMMINVPMNEALAELAVPSDAVEAAALWDAYSGRWQFWNAVRTVASGIALLLASIGLKRSGARFGREAILVAGAR